MADDTKPAEKPAKKPKTRKVRLPVTVYTPIVDETGRLTGSEAHAPGELVELDAAEAEALVAKFGEVTAPSDGAESA